jgi:hypothetical protein
MIGEALRTRPICTLLLALTEAGGDPGIFCYRMGVDILSADDGRFLAPVNAVATFATRTLAMWQRNQVACSNLSSTFSRNFSIHKSCRHLSVKLGLR